MFTDNSSFIVLYTNDLNTTKDFYKSIKADLIEEEVNKIVFRLGSNEIHFVSSKGNLNSDYIYNNSGQLGQGILIYLGTKNIKKTHTLIAKNNPNNITAIKPNNWESKEFLFEDINGYKFVCYEDLLDF
jgi:predicted enzyme related to lactoylglutathione lyase